MTKFYFAKSKETGEITFGNWPIREACCEHYEFDVNQSDIDEVLDGTKDIQIGVGEINFVASTRKADRVAAEEEKQEAEENLRLEKAQLKQKLVDGVATDEDIKKALKKLL